MSRLWIPALVVLLTWLLVGDVAGTAPGTGAPPPPVVRDAPGASAPARPPEPLRVSAAVAANEFGTTMMVGRLPGGATPGQDQDCQGSYEWMRDHDAQLVFGLRMRVWLAASRYTQVVFQSASLREVGTPHVDYDTELAMYSCGDSGLLPYPGDEDAESELVGVRQETGLWFLPALEIPTDPPDPLAAPSSWGEPYPFDVLAADTASFTIDVTIPGYAEPTDFVVDLRLRVNGADRTFVLRDGDQPFRLFPDPGGAGFSPDWYYWCPGTPGHFKFQRGDEKTESWTGC